MKKIGLILFLLLWLPLIALAAPAEHDPKGFNRYLWGTSFDTIHAAENLQREPGETIYWGTKNTVMQNGRLVVQKGFVFEDNQLVGANLLFFDKKAYDQYLEFLKELLGPPDDFEPDTQFYYYEFPSATICYKLIKENGSPIGGIIFLSKK